jgi:Amt family ammonium transporter
LSPGDNAWQLTAATLVGLMSIPGLVVLYGGIVQKKWSINSMMMAFTAFSIVLLAWVLWGFNMSFGHPLHLGSGFLDNAVGRPSPVVSHLGEQSQANIPLLASAGPAFRFPQSTLVYFQFVFAAITPILFLGSVLGRMSLKAWMLFVLAWSSLVYTVNAFLIWGGGWWAQQGAVDYSGGYVIHLAAGVTGFVAAWVVGPRLRRDREQATPNNLLLVAAGAGLLWLGWNGFNGGDPYFAGADASAAVLNTNLSTAAALMVWVFLDLLSPRRRSSLVGAVNGMIVGLVAITPAAGWVNGGGAILIGVLASAIVWVSMNIVGTRGVFRKVDDALGVVHTHGVAGLVGGLMVGLIADPKMIQYLNPNFAVKGLFYGHPRQLLVQAGAAGWVIVWSAVMTFVILKVIGLLMPLRMSEEELVEGDIAVHGEQVYTDLPGEQVPVPPLVAPAGAAGD